MNFATAEILKFSAGIFYYLADPGEPYILFNISIEYKL